MRKRNPIATKQAILEAAIEAYNHNGYALTKVEDIALSAGVAKGSVYWHFKGKEQIFLALMGSWVDTLYAIFQRIRYEERSAEDKLRVLLEQSLLNPGKNILYLSTEFWNHHQTNEEAVQRLRGLYDRYVEMYRILLFDGMVNHEFKAIDIEELTASFMGMIEGIFSHQLLKNRDRTSSSKAFVTGVEIFLMGIRNDRRPQQPQHEEEKP